MSRRILEHLKTVVIAGLLVNILFLSLMALPVSTVSRLPLPGFLAAALGVPERPAAQDDAMVGHTAAAMPVLLSIHQEAGRSSIRRAPEAMENAYGRFGTFLRTGLATAEGGVVYTGDWSFLDSPGVLFFYDGRIPAQALCHWLDGRDCAVTDVCSGYLLSCEADGVILYTISGNEIRRYTTTVSHASLLALLGEYTPDGSDFAYKRHGSTAAPMTLWETSVTIPDCAAENPVTADFSRAIATALDFNPYGAGTYTDPDGSTVYTESDRSLTVDPDGSMLLAVSGESYTRFHAASDSATDLIDTAGELLDVVFGSAMGDADLYLCDFWQEGEVTRLSYRYNLAGVPVYPTCAEVTFLGSRFADLRCTLRTFVQRGTSSVLLPLPQAAAIAEPGKRLFPAYDLSAAGTVKAGWLAQ